MTARDLPDPAAWGLPGCDFAPLSGGARGRVLRGTGPAEAYVFKTTQRSEAQLAWLDHARAPAVRAGFVFVVPTRTLRGGWQHDGWTAEPYTPTAPVSNQDLPDLRARIARLHDLGRDVPQRPGFATVSALVDREVGGDIDLGSMPRALVRACRAAWGAVPRGAAGLLHGDLNPSNLGRSPAGKLVLYDWDEARVDLPLFDHVPLGATQDPMAIRAALAYEVACCWRREPTRARALAAVLLAET